MTAATTRRRLLGFDRQGYLYRRQRYARGRFAAVRPDPFRLYPGGHPQRGCAARIAGRAVPRRAARAQRLPDGASGRAIRAPLPTASQSPRAALGFFRRHWLRLAAEAPLCGHASMAASPLRRRGARALSHNV